jgi:hypothetical protein
MKSMTRAWLAAGSLFLLVAPAWSADTITGEIVDMACYVPHPETSKGAGHRKCADTCLKKGMPMGLVTEDKQVFLILEDHDNPKPYAALKEKAAQTVTIEGEKVNNGGVQGFVVGDLK